MLKFDRKGTKEKVPGIALRGVVPIPDCQIKFDVSRERSKYTVEQAMLSDHMVFLISQKSVTEDNPNIAELEEIGVYSRIISVSNQPNGNLTVVAEGISRAFPLNLVEKAPGLVFEIRTANDIDTDPEISPEKLSAMNETMDQYVQTYLYLGPSGQAMKDIYDKNSILSTKKVNKVAGTINMSRKDRQDYLALDNLEDRVQFVCVKMLGEVEVAKYKKELQELVKQEIDKNQKEYVLREQMKVIRKELGEDEENESEEMLEKLNLLDMPEDSRSKIKKEITRFGTMSPYNQESMMLRTYIETVLGMPWNKKTDEEMDILKAKTVLEEDHYGLEKIKERILEYLAVREQLRRANEKGEKTEIGDHPILCLIGPPGTGKTSIAKSIARALNKKYVRICLGGIKDEAEIRGHRKTYIGAMPGRISNAILQAGVNNPVMLLDEIDKVGSDYKGDPSAALLEVLDPEQNVAFRDHYLEIPIDLTGVLFVATANDASTIPRPLLDRMELIEVSGYTENEKYHIATRYLIPKQLKANGLSAGQVEFTKEAVEKLIGAYTREAGVRKLEQQIASVLRKEVCELLEKESDEKIVITPETVVKLLGKEKFRFDMASETPKVGIARGLAWTSVGGDTLEIEVSIVNGKGGMTMTGKLGDVMKESVTIAISHVKTLLEDVNLSEDYFDNHNIHLHVPEGAVPKDGPSAGITMATAVYSAVTDRPVRSDLAMTGEITLRGRVLPIGGLKEKLLAAKKCGVKTVIVPAQNRADVEELSGEIVDGLEIVYVETMKQVLETALV